MKNRNIATTNHIEGFARAGVLDWINYTSSPKTALHWRDLGFTPDEMQTWRDGFCNPLGALPEDAKAYRDRGFTPKQALRNARRTYPSPMKTR